MALARGAHVKREETPEVGLVGLRLHFIVMALGALDIALIHTTYRLDGFPQAALVQVIAYFPVSPGAGRRTTRRGKADSSET